MSLWQRERLQAWLSPSRVALAPAKTWGRRAKKTSPCELPIAAAEGCSSFAPAVDAFTALLAQHLARAASIDVVLSDHFVRYAVLAWRPGLSASEWQAYARHEIERIYGTVSERRLLRIAPAKRGAARIAAAIDAGLVDALNAATSAHRCRLQALESNACRIVNGSLRRAQGEGHLLVAEPGRLTRLTLRQGVWCDVQSIRCNAEVSEAAARMLAELESGPTGTLEHERIWYSGRADEADALAGKRIGSFTLLPGPAYAFDGGASLGGL